MEESFHLTYPHIRHSILPIAEKFDEDNFQGFLKSDKVCRSFTAACDLYLHLDEDALLGLPYHLHFEVIKRFVNVCSKISVEEIVKTAKYKRKPTHVVRGMNDLATKVR